MSRGWEGDGGLKAGGNDRELFLFLNLFLHTATKWMDVNVKNHALLINGSLDQICVCHCALEDNKQIDEALHPVFVSFFFPLLNVRRHLSGYQVPFISSLMIPLFHGTPLP